MKKTALIILIVLLVLIGLGVGSYFLFFRGKKAKEPEAPKDEGVLIETTLEERPYVTLIPRADGREFTLDIARIKNAETIEYELVYLSDGLSRGVVGSVKLKGEGEISRKLLLGTCSRGKCKYDENVSEGTLTVRFRSSEGVRKFDTDFHLQQGDDVLTSMDGAFSLEGSFSASAYYLTMSTVGLPGESEGEVLVGPYGSFTAGSSAVKSGQVTMMLGQDDSAAKLSSWEKTDWEEVEEAEVAGKEVSGSTTTLGTFIVSTALTTSE